MGISCTTPTPIRSVWNDFSTENGGGTGTTAVSTGETAAAAEPLTAESAPSGGTGVDTDGDRLADADEAAWGTDPTNPDTDGDGYYDGDEVNLSTDPLDPASHP